MDVNVKVTIDLGDKTMSLFNGIMATNDAVTKATDAAVNALKKFADEPVNEERRAERSETRSTRPEPAAAREEPAGGNEPYTEEELRDMSPKDLTAILKREFNVDPDDFDGKNTNKKLRDLILDAQEGKLDNEPETDIDDEKTSARATDGDNETAPARSTDVTRDDIRNLMSEVIEADDSTRPKILKEFGRIGAKNIGTIKDEDVVDFFEFLQSLKTA